MKLTKGGVLCEPNDPHALADAIERLLLNPDNARELGKQGRKAVLENFSVEGMANDMVQALEKVMREFPRKEGF